MSPSVVTCALPGCPMPTPGNYCIRHANMTEAEEHAEITAIALRRARHAEIVRRAGWACDDQ